MDVSVLVQNAATGGPRLDVPVEVIAHPVGEPERVIRGTATVEAATNKLFRAALLDLSEPGRWRFEVRLPGQTGMERAAFEAEVLPALPDWVESALWIGWPFLIVLLFGLHEYVKMRSGRGSRLSAFPRAPTPPTTDRAE